MTLFTSSINLSLPLASSIEDSLTQDEMQGVYNAFRVVLLELEKVKADIVALKQYNIAHP